MRDCREIRAALPAFLADNLSGEERRDFESHLAQCPACARALEALSGMTELLKGAPLTPEPDPELERHVFALVQHDEAARLAQIAPLRPEPAPDLEDRALDRAGALQAPAPRRSLWPRLTAVLTPTFGLAALLLGALLITTDPSPVELGPTDSPSGHFMQQIRLTGAGEADLALVHFRHDNYRLTLSSTDDLPPLTEGHHYELWLSGTDGLESAGSFRYIRPDQFAIDFNVGIDPAEYNEVEITEEPDDGDTSKTGDRVCRGWFDPAKVHH
ncbi:MAG TPA: anti-sigma factor [Actinomycetota bacterium]|nr:anti-sigma factor [Actinomycetota bacterium]